MNTRKLGSTLAGIRLNVSLGDGSGPEYVLMKDAASLKGAGRFDEACDKLREAYASGGPNMLMVRDYLRLPMYLLLAARAEEGWQELLRLHAFYQDSQFEIAHKMRVFCKKEGAGRDAASFLIDATTKQGRETQQRLRGPIIPEPKPIPSEDDYFVDRSSVFRAWPGIATPLRVMLHHGEVFATPGATPPRISNEEMQGHWQLSRNSASRLDLDAFNGATPERFVARLQAPFGGDYIIASAVGPVSPAEFFPYVVAIRTILENDDASIEERIEALRSLDIPQAWAAFHAAYRGTEGLIDQFFPRFSTIHGNWTPNTIAETPDQTLLTIPGVGPAKLRALREKAAAAVKNRDSRYVDEVQH